MAAMTSSLCTSAPARMPCRLHRPRNVRGPHLRTPAKPRALRVCATNKEAGNISRKVQGIDTTSTTKAPLRLSVDGSGDDDLESCTIGEIYADNDIDDKYTVISVKVGAYPGLIRIITWVLTGLSIEVHRATLRTDPVSGIANDVFWVTQHGKKLAQPEEVVERLESFVQSCITTPGFIQPQQFEEGPIFVDNEAHEAYTMLTITVSRCPKKAAAVRLLDVVAAITGVGLAIMEGDIETSSSDSPESEGIWVFMITDHKIQKLNYVQITGLMFTLSEIFGHRLVKPF